MKTTTMAQWYGSNRMLAPRVGQELAGCEWVGVPFCGGCCELPYIQCRSGIASDLHRHIINLARVVREPELLAQLVARLEATPFHQEQLHESQMACLDCDVYDSSFPPDVIWAFHYFVAVWMARGGAAGTEKEFDQGLSTRWNAGGGDSCKRFRSATESLAEWQQVCSRWTFLVLDVFEFLRKCKDQDRHGLYVDAPWVEAGDDYRHKFTAHGELAAVLSAYRKTRVVIRYGDCPEIRALYPPDRWTYVEQISRTQANTGCAEVLIINGPSFTAETVATDQESRLW